MDKLKDFTTNGGLQLQKLIEHVNAGVVIHSHDTTILLANQEASRLLGLSVNQLMGKMAIDPAWRFVRLDGTKLPLGEYPIEKIIATSQAFDNYKMGIVRPSTNDRVWVEVCAYPEFDEERKLNHVVITFVDITEQIETQKALTESEVAFSRVFQYSPGIMLITKAEDGTIVETNQKIIETGYTREDLIGQSINNMNFWLNPSDRKKFDKRLKGEGKIENFEADFVRKTGEIFTCLVSGETIKFHHSDCIVSVLIDISKRKESENQINILYEIVQGVLHTSDLEELLKLIHESIKKVMFAENCFFALYDNDTGLFSFPYHVDQFDNDFYPQEMLRSCTYYIYKTGNSLLITPEIFQKLSDDNEIELFGPPSPSWIGIPLKTSSRTIGVLVLQHYTEANIYNERHLKLLDSIGSQVANVIERKWAESELEKSHSLISATLESTADGILVVDKTGKITCYNRKFLELWRIPEAIIATNSDEKLLHYAMEQLVDPASFLNKVQELYHKDDEISNDFLEFKDGRIFKRYSQAQVFEHKCVGRVWSFQNITAQTEALKALNESEIRLRELNATKDKFFSIIAHDLKSPFNGILGFSNILADQIKEKDYDNIEEYAEIIRHSSQKAFDLLINLMEWSSSQSGRMDFDPQLISLESIIQEVMDQVKISALQKSIHITTKLAGPITASVDKKMISSVLRNLIANAIKFTHPGGTIEIMTERDTQQFTVSVKDNGIGLEPVELKKLFRIDQSYSIPGTQNEKGTGLGLILCKEFIGKHGGRIWAESEPGKGSLFCFTIPFSQ